MLGGITGPALPTPPERQPQFGNEMGEQVASSPLKPAMTQNLLVAYPDASLFSVLEKMTNHG